MVDNVQANSGSGGATFATDEITGVHYPYAKMAWGANNTVTLVDTSTGAIPIQDGGNSITIDDGSSSITVDGTVNAAQSGTWNITNVSGTVSLPTNAATETTLASVLTSVQLLDDAIIADDAAFTPATTKVLMAGFEFDDSTPDSVNEGDAGAARMSANRNIYTQIRDAAGNERGANVNASGQLSVSVDNTVTVASHAVTNAGTFPVQIDGAALTSLQLIDDAVSGSGFNISQMNGVAVTMGNGASGTGVQRVTLANDSTGVLATVSTVTTLTGSSIAHDSADSGNPHKLGAKAETALSGITLVADGDRTDLYAGVDGVLITRPHCNLEDIVTGNASNTDGTSTSCIAAQGAGVKTYLMAFTVTNTSSSNTFCEIKDGTTAKMTVSVPANGGVTVNLPIPIPGTANTAWNFDMGAATTTAYCSMVGFKSKV